MRWGCRNDCVKMLMAGSVLEAAWDPVPVPPSVCCRCKNPSDCGLTAAWRSVSADGTGAAPGIALADLVGKSGMGEGEVAHAWDA